MANCNNCGFELAQGAKFCDNCGAKTEQANPNAQMQNPTYQANENVQERTNEQQNNAGQNFAQAPVQASTQMPAQGNAHLPAQGSFNASPVQGQMQQPVQQTPQSKANVNPYSVQAPMGNQQVAQHQYAQPQQNAQTPTQAYGTAPNAQQPMQPQMQQPMQPQMQQPMQPQMPMQNQYGGGVGVATKPKKPSPIIFVGLGVAALVVVIVIIALISSLFSGGSDDPNIGVWTADEITMMGITMSPEDIYPDGINLELKSGNNCTLTFDGDDYNADYEIDGTTFTLVDGSDEFPGTINGNEITITNLLNMGIDIKFVKDDWSGEDTNGAGAGAVIDENNLTGKYILSSMTTAGVVMNYDALQQTEIEMTLEITGEDATLNAYGSSSDVELDTSAKTMLLQGIVMSYVIDGENIVASGDNAGHELVFVFTSENSSIWSDTSGGGVNATGFIPPGYGAAQTMPVETLSNPSDWYGTITVSDYTGPYADDMAGEHEAWGFIGSDEQGDYFEILVEGIYTDTNLILSYDAEIHDYTFFPLEGGTSWIFDRNLIEEDYTWYTPTLINGILTATYYYEDEDETFTFVYELAQIVDESGAQGTQNTESTTGGTQENEPEPAPEPTQVAASMTMDQLRDIYLAIGDLSIDDKYALTYEVVKERYFGGVDGNITNQGDTFVSYQWVSVESETSLLNISFDTDDGSEFTYKSMSINNIDYE